MFRIKVRNIVCLIALSLFSTQLSFSDEYKESGRFGVEGLITNDGFHAGLVRETDSYEVAADFDGSVTNTSKSTQTGDIGLDLRAGPRFNIGSFNYFSAGLNYHTAMFGHDSGVSTAGDYYVGPYIGLQRHFSGTNLMLSLYVLPYSYNHSIANDGNNNPITTNSHKFFQQGGFGIAYLF